MRSERREVSGVGVSVGEGERQARNVAHLAPPAAAVEVAAPSALVAGGREAG